ncbi:MAG: hypothetical protein IJZ72_00515 [Oscillospiraceae bacterium]|nr:hypothetical protein [Oscillospiraceae bacterium]
MKFANANAFLEEEKLDERQNAIRGEIAHECMQLWYVLSIMFTMLGFAGAFVFPEISVMVFIAVNYMITFLCLGIYNVKLAEKGVLTSFTGVKPTASGKKTTYLCMVCCMAVIIFDNIGKTGLLSRLSAVEIGCFIMMFAVGIVYDIVYRFCVKKNTAVTAEQLDDE